MEVQLCAKLPVVFRGALCRCCHLRAHVELVSSLMGRKRDHVQERAGAELQALSTPASSFMRVRSSGMLLEAHGICSKGVLFVDIAMAC